MTARRFLPVLLLAISTAGAQSNSNAPQQGAWNPSQILKSETFVNPPANVERIIMAPRTDISFTAPSPDRKWFLKSNGTDRGDIAAYGKPHIYLAGIPIDTIANRSRTLTTSTRRAPIWRATRSRSR